MAQTFFKVLAPQEAFAFAARGGTGGDGKSSLGAGARPRASRGSPFGRRSATFHRAAMDGYAVKAKDTFGRVKVCLLI
jgi:hypothetical protein